MTPNPDAGGRAARSALLELPTKWRQTKAQIDTFHATMGTGYGACADELEAALEAAGLAAGDRQSPLQIDELFQELEVALWNKIGNTWEATQGQRVEAFLRKYLRVAGDRPSLGLVHQCAANERHRFVSDYAIPCPLCELERLQVETLTLKQGAVGARPAPLGDRPSLPEQLTGVQDWLAHKPFCHVMGQDARFGWRAGDEAVCNCGLIEWMRNLAVGARPAPQEPIDPKAVEELRVALVAGCQWLSDKANARQLAWGVPESETEKLIHRCVGALRTGWSILCELTDRALPVSSPAPARPVIQADKGMLPRCQCKWCYPSQLFNLGEEPEPQSIRELAEYALTLSGPFDDTDMVHSLALAVLGPKVAAPVLPAAEDPEEVFEARLFAGELRGQRSEALDSQEKSDGDVREMRQSQAHGASVPAVRELEQSHDSAVVGAVDSSHSDRPSSTVGAADDQQAATRPAQAAQAETRQVASRPAILGTLPRLEKVAGDLELEAGDCSQLAPRYPHHMATFLYESAGVIRQAVSALQHEIAQLKAAVK